MEFPKTHPVGGLCRLKLFVRDYYSRQDVHYLRTFTAGVCGYHTRQNPLGKSNAFADLPEESERNTVPGGEMGAGNAAATPVCDGQFVYACFGNGIVACYDLLDNASG